MHQIFRSAKLPESNASAPMNKLPKKRLGWTEIFIWKRGVLSIVLTKQVVLTENTSSNIKKITRTTVSFVTTYHPELSNLSNKHPELCKIFKEPRPPVLAFRKSKSLKDILVRADISPRSAYNDQCKNDVWRAKTFNANRSSAAHIQEKNSSYMQCQLQDRKYYLPPGMCNLWPSIRQRNNLVNAWMATEALQIANLTFHSADISDRRATMILSANWRSP